MTGTARTPSNPETLPITHYVVDRQDHTNAPEKSGTVLIDATVARVQAVIFAGASLRDHLDLVWSGQTIREIVRNDDRTILVVVLAQSVDLS